MSRRLHLSRPAAGLLSIFFGLFLVFLYAPTIVLIVFSFNDSVVAAFPFVGFTTGVVRGGLAGAGRPRRALGVRQGRDRHGADRHRARPARLVRARAAAVRRRKAAISALVLLPLVVPTVVLGVALLVLFRRRPRHPDAALASGRC